MLFPIALTKVTGSLAVVVGGGAVGERKVGTLLAAAARIRLVSPAATAQLQEWHRGGLLEWRRRPYQYEDLEDAHLVFAATDQRAVNRQVGLDAAHLGRLCNVADRAEEGTFHMPAVVRRDDLVVAVSTESATPGRAQQVRDRIAAGALLSSP